MYKIIICHSTVLILDLEVATEIRASDHFLMSLVISDTSQTEKMLKQRKGKTPGKQASMKTIAIRNNIKLSTPFEIYKFTG